MPVDLLAKKPPTAPRDLLAVDDSPSTALDIVKSGASGLARGALDLAGLPGTIGDVLDAGGQYALRKGYELATGNAPGHEGGAVERFFAGPDPRVTERLMGAGGNPLSGASLKNAAAQLTGGATNYDPQTTAGEYAATVGEFLPGAAAFGGLSPSNLARFGAAPAIASEAAGQATEGSAAEPYARIAAALVAPGIPAVAARAVTPLRVGPERMAAADILRSEGVRPTAGQITGSKGLRYAEGELGGAKTAQILEDQADAFTNAAMSKAGASGRATPENMAALNQKLSGGFKEIASRNTMKVDQGLIDDMSGTLAEYQRVLPTEQKTIIKNMAQDIVDRFKAGKGTISGDDYQAIRSRLTKRAFKARNSDAELADAYRGLRNALDEGMNRSIRPEDAGRWAQLRREYGNMKVLERAATGGGEDAAMGLISPAKLRQAATTGNRGGYARGEGDFSRLSRAGNALLAPLPNSGTAARTNARNLGAGILAGGGALAGGPLGMIAGMAAPVGGGRALMSRPIQAYLANQAAPAVKFADPRYSGIVQALISQNVQRDRQALGGR